MRHLAVLAALVLTVACGKDEESGHHHEHTATEHPALDLTGDATAGATVYADTCGACHGADGTGGIGPSLVEHAPMHSDEELVATIVNGTGTMEPVALEDQEIADVLAYIRATFG
jgi:mono/diheme cytochrome c family protein